MSWNTLLLLLCVALAIAIRQFLVLPIKPQGSIPHCSFDGDYLFNVENVYSPTSLEEIQMVINRAKEHGQKIRVLGAGHSRSAIALSEDIYISLHKYKGLVEFDENAKVASFRGGTTIGQINQVLFSRGFSLSILPAFDQQTIAGAISTATHGSSLRHGNLATLLTSLQIVTGTGEILNITKDLSPDIFYAAGVSLGLFGVITEVTLSTEKLENVVEKQFSLSTENCMNNFDAIMSGAEYVKLWIELNADVCLVYSANRTDKVNIEDMSSFNFKQGLKMKLLETFQWIFSVFPSLTKSGMKMLFYTDFFFPPYKRIVESEEFHIDKYYMSPNRQIEISVPLTDCIEAINRLKSVINIFHIPVNHIIEIRVVKSDQFLMSNNYERDSCHITLMMYNPSMFYWNLYYYEFYRVTVPLGGRPHWGKHFNMTFSEVKDLFPMVFPFLNVRKKLDPDGIFLNTQMRKTFGFSDE